MNNAIKNKIDKLKAIYLTPEDQRELDDIERNIRRKLAETKLSERDDIKLLVSDSLRRIKEIDIILSSDETMKDDERKVLFKEKKTIKYYVIDRLGCKKIKKELEIMYDAIDDKLDE